MNNQQLVAKLLHNGGRALIAGGEMKDLPQEYRNHPQIIVWDDDVQEYLNKDVPSNVKVIIYTRFISHKAANKLSRAARDLHAIKFPMRRIREVKELMADVISPPVVPTVVEQTVETTPKVEETTMGRGMKPRADVSVKGFIKRHLNTNLDFSVRGSKTIESDRIFEIAKKENFQTTRDSLRNATGEVLRSLKTKHRPEVKVEKKQENGVDDFAELDKLLEDAISAMKLIQEHLPKVRKETEKLRGMKEKVLNLFN